MVYIIAAILIFGVLIAVHELGHFLAAKACGVRVNEFSIGMGPALYHRKKGDTEYSIRILPIGGYCAMEGEDEDSSDPHALNNCGFWQKVLIFAAGAGMNFLAGVVIIFALYVGASGFYTAQVADFDPDFPLQGENGLMVGDVFYKIDGYRIYTYSDALMYLSYNDGQGIDLVVLRNGKKVVLNDFPMYRGTYDGEAGRFGLSIGVHEEPGTFFNKLKFTWYSALDYVQLVRFSLVQLITGGASADDLSGPVGIISTISEVGQSAETTRQAVSRIMSFAALIAVNLAVMNLLPLPALDGGKIFFLLVNTVSKVLFGRQIPPKYEGYIHGAGFVLLMALMVFVTYNDIVKLFA